MEVQIPQQQQKVQISLNNKIITLHNVTIVKNPRIVKVDAAQYSSLLLKGANGPIKFVNGSAVSSPIKLPIPSLVPMKRVVTGAPVKLATTTASQNVTNPVIQTVIKQASPNFITTQFIKTNQQQQFTINGILPQFKSQTILTSTPVVSTANSPTKIQTIPVKQQSTVIISPPKNPTAVITSPSKQHQQVIHPLAEIPPPQIKFNYQTSPNQTSVITPIVVNTASQASPKINGTSTTPAILPIQTKVIVSPPIKNKNLDILASVAAEELPLNPPSPKRSKIEFQCIFCKEKFLDDPQLLVNHMKILHPEKIPNEKNNQETDLNNKNENVLEEEEKMDSSSSSSSSDSSDSSSNESSSDENDDENMSEDEEDDDASEVNDLINDLEDTQDTEASSQERSNTPESPEFEEHVPSQNDANVNEIKEEVDDYFAADEEDQYEWDCKIFAFNIFDKLLKYLFFSTRISFGTIL